MQIFAGSNPVDAHFDVELLDGSQTIVFRSRGGNPVRNAQYNEGLELLLRRLGELGAQLSAAVVDSTETRRAGISYADRLLDPGPGRSYPVGLVKGTDFAALRLSLGRSQAQVGRRAGARGSGNYTKQIRLYVTLAGGPLSPSELERKLAYDGTAGTG